jgi:hypothetical protein
MGDRQKALRDRTDGGRGARRIVQHALAAGVCACGTSAGSVSDTWG